MQTGHAAARVHALRASLLAATAIGALVLGSQAWAGGTLPNGGKVVSGSAALSATGNGLTVNQSTSRAIIDWKNFSIGAGNSVQFNNGSGATLNRVTGSAGSSINGFLGSTGSVFLINPNGVVIGANGKVVTNGGFVASSRDISNGDFSNGNLNFAGSSSGDVSNAGSITSSNGDVVLIGRSVSNSGSIAAAHGTAGLAAGDQVNLRPASGDQRISIAAGTGNVTNSGMVSAAAAELKAADGNVYALAGNNGGIVRATGTKTAGGHIWLTSNGGDVNVSGSVAATNADGSGGAVTVRGANINVSGAVDASATVKGKTGGNVSIVARDTTNFSGTIKAEGGTSGKGGQVETSGEHLHIADGARVFTGSQDGFSGDWLLDPNDFTIAASGGDMTGATLSANLAGGDVTISSNDGATPGNGDIFVNDAVSWSSAHTLTLNAVRNVQINAAISGVNGGFTLNLPGTVTTSAAGTVDVGTFFLTGGAQWLQIGASLPSFHATDFRTDGDNNHTAFVRALAGDGTSANPYQLVDIYGVQGIRDILPPDGGTYYTLANDIDATATKNWNSGAGFRPVNFGLGGLDGQGHVIDGLFINRPSTDGVGLFQDLGFWGLDHISVSNLGLTNVDITGDGIVGALAGSFGAYADTNSLSNIWATGTVTGSGDQVGGLIGIVTMNDGVSQLDRLSSSATVSGNISVGGLFGEFDDDGTTLSQSHATGDVTAAGEAGGLIGYMQFAAISQSYATGNVTGAFNTGGLVGNANGGDGTIDQSYATGNVTGDEELGGLVGSSIDETITRSYATGAVTGTAGNAGGLIGQLSGGSVSTSFATGDVTSGGSAIGGLIGSGGGVFHDVYATGSVTGTSGADDIGGLVGVNFTPGSSDGYATGVVTGPGVADIGGAIGTQNAGTTVTDVYWDTQTSGLSIGVGSGSTASVTGLTTAQLQGSLPAGFSGATWGTGAHLYPYFGWLYPTAPVAISGIAYSDGGTTALSGVDVTAISGGVALGSTSTGANGYYYILAPSGALNAAGVLAYLDGDATKAVGFADNITDTSDIDIFGASLNLHASATSLSTTIADLNTTLGSFSDSDLNFFATTGGNLSTSSGGIYLDAASNYTFDANITSAGLLSLSSGGTFGLSGSHTLQAGGALTLGDDVAWSSASALTLQTTGTNDIVLNGAITAATGRLNLNLAGTATPGSSAAIDLGIFNITGGGTWSQIGSSLPSFQATDFRVDPTAFSGNYTAFVRALGGDGSSADPYQLFDIYGVQGMSFGNAGGVSRSYVLANDIDASGTQTWNAGQGFRPVYLPFGTFDGAGHVIDGLYIDRPGVSTQGLFGSVGGSSTTPVSITDLGLTNVNITGGDHVGALAGDVQVFATSGNVIQNVWSTGTVTGTSANVGGLLGSIIANHASAQLSDLWSSATVSGTGSVGGLSGYVDGADLSASHASGNISATDDGAGGLIGVAQQTNLSDSYATGDVSSSGAIAGGLVGYAFFGDIITRTYATGTVQGNGEVGGLVGALEEPSPAAALITQSYATGDVTDIGTGGDAGGLVGYMGGGTLDTSFATGNVTSGGSSVGGLVGYNAIVFHDVYATGDVTGTGSANFLGGLIGENLGNGSNAYSTGSVTGGNSATLGGAFGRLDAGATVTGIYWDKQTSGISTGVGDGAAAGVSGLTTAQLEDPSSFAGWDIDDQGGTGATWRIYDGLTAPLLRTFLTSVTVTADDASKTYDGSAYTGFTYSSSDPSAVLLGTLGSDLTSKNAGTYTIANGLYSGQVGYDITVVAGTLTIDKKTLTLGLIGSVSKTYDGNMDAVLGLGNYAGLGFVTGDDVALTGYGSGSYGDKNAGNGKSVSVSGLGLSGADANNYTLASTSLSANIGIIDPKTLTVSVSANDKVYDGTTAATGSIGSVSGVITGDDVNASGGTLAFADANAGANKSVSVTGINLSGADAGNYVLSPTAATTADITPATLTVTADDKSRIYGDANPSLTYGYSGFVAGDGASLFTGALATGATKTSGVGNYTITQGNLSAGGNYVIAYMGGTLAITARPITITADDLSRVSGAANPSLTYSIGGDGLVNGDTLTGALATRADTTSAAGLYAITQGTLSAGANYAVTFRPGTLTVTDSATIDPLTILDPVFAFAGTRGGTTSWDSTSAFLPGTGHGFGPLSLLIDLTPVASDAQNNVDDGVPNGQVLPRFTISFDDLFAGGFMAPSLGQGTP